MIWFLWRKFCHLIRLKNGLKMSLTLKNGLRLCVAGI